MRRSRAIALPASVRLGGPHPSRFGLGRRWLLEWSEEVSNGLSPDARLFLGAYAAGFAAISLFIA